MKSISLLTPQLSVYIRRPVNDSISVPDSQNLAGGLKEKRLQVAALQSYRERAVKNGNYVAQQLQPLADP